MGLYDRPYWRDDGESGRGRFGQLTVGLPKPAPAVKFLLIANLVVFVIQLIIGRFVKPDLVERLFGASVEGWWQLWRYVTFQFLHSWGIWHIALNMLGLYLLGSPLERHWGTRRFLEFYLSCGAVAGVVYVVLAALLRLDPRIPLIGASGGVFGILLACAVLFPSFRIIFLFFPVPIRLAALILFGGMVLSVLFGNPSAADYWSHVAHFGGVATAAVWIWVIPNVRGATRTAAVRINRGAWRRKMKKRHREEQQIDRILSKIHEDGISSLSRKEKKILREATRRQRDEERDLHRL